MLPQLPRRSAGVGASLFVTVVSVVGCGEAIKTPFFDERGAASGGSAASQGGTSGTGTGGANGGSIPAGGDAGSLTGGTASGGDAGMAGLSGASGSGATGGTGSGGDPSGGGGGVSGTNTGGTNTGGTGGTPVECSSLDSSAVAFESHCYVFRATLRTWAQARDDCASDGAHLVTLSSQDRTEEQFLAENAFVWMLGGAGEKWIGATDGRSSNQSGNGTPYTWITGETMVHDLWSTGQPNNSQTACMANAPCSCGDMCWEHCGFMWDPDNDEPGTWNDRHCEHQIGYVCEWDAPPV